MTNLAIDYSFSRPDPHKIKAAGYRGVMRYLSNDPKKNLTAAEAKALHAAGLWIGLVWETTTARATKGRLAGRLDRRKAESMAKALGVPKGVVIFYAVDGDYSPSQVKSYFEGVAAGATYRYGPYGSYRICDAYPHLYSWQTIAWSHGKLSFHANLYQNGHTVVYGDVNAVEKTFPAWVPASKPTPKPTTPQSASPDQQLVAAFNRWRAQKKL